MHKGGIPVNKWPSNGPNPTNTNTDQHNDQVLIDRGHFQPFTKVIFESYICPSDVLPKVDDQGYGKSNYMGCSGSRYQTDPVGNPNEWLNCAQLKGDEQNGMLLYANENNRTWVVRMADVIDGTSNTIFVGETSCARNVRPDRTNNSSFPTWCGGNNNRSCAGFRRSSALRLANGVFFLNRGVKDWKANPNNDQGSLEGKASFGSQHPGGAQFLFADGSVHFISENISTVVYSAVAGRNDNIAVSFP